ncbi:MAG: VOC family protein [Thermoplasmata archaeon]
MKYRHTVRWRQRRFEMIDGYTDVAVVVADREKAKKWYCGVLGFHLVLDRRHAVAVSPDAKGKGLVLHLCGDDFAPLEPGNTGIGFTADDIARTCSDLERNGVRFTVPLQDEAGYKHARFLDPDGNEFWLFESSVARKVMPRRTSRRPAARHRARGTVQRRRTKPR